MTPVLENIWKGVTETELLKADFHIHTEYSMDCNTPLEKIIERCLEVGINCIAVSDHGTIEGAMEMQRLSPFSVIVAEEVLTPHGEVMGMFLNESIPGGLSAEETVAQIKSQDGLVCIPHPFDALRPSALNAKIVEEIAGQIDIMEGFNSRNPFTHNATKIQAFAEKHGLVQSAGSDAHTLHEIGNAYVEMPEFEGRDDFLQALGKGKIIGRKTNPLNHLYSTWAKMKNIKGR
ncbi:MAG: PHP domain-containing protein [Dehalococcoidales bacterium]|nr:PHP domain-containing protein [Dehalococcoidales bacterium]